jgi:C-terminal processing protease CtpA/Prc
MQSNPAGESSANTIVEIPPVQPVNPPHTIVETTTDPNDAGGNGAQQSEAASHENEVDDYEASQHAPPQPQPHFHSLQEFMSEGSDTSPIGLELREDSRKLDTGEQADGLLIMKVHRASPAAQAGLRSYSTVGHSLLEGAAIAAAMFFPPAVLAIAAFDQTHVGESYDMIIGVDGKRVTNYLDFEDEMRDVKPGDVVYLSVVRNGKRMQIPVDVPATATSLSY